MHSDASGILSRLNSAFDSKELLTALTIGIVTFLCGLVYGRLRKRRLISWTVADRIRPARQRGTDSLTRTGEVALPVAIPAEPGALRAAVRGRGFGAGCLRGRRGVEPVAGCSIISGTKAPTMRNILGNSPSHCQRNLAH